MYLRMLISIGLAIIFFFQFFWMDKSEKRSIKQLEDINKRTILTLICIVCNNYHKKQLNIENKKEP